MQYLTTNIKPDPCDKLPRKKKTFSLHKHKKFAESTKWNSETTFSTSINPKNLVKDLPHHQSIVPVLHKSEPQPPPPTKGKQEIKTLEEKAEVDLVNQVIHNNSESSTTTTKVESCLTVSTSRRSSSTKTSISPGVDLFNSILSPTSEADDVDKLISNSKSTLSKEDDTDTSSLLLGSLGPLFQIRPGKPCSKQIESEIPEVEFSGDTKLRGDCSESGVEERSQEEVGKGRIEGKENTRDVENGIISYSREVWKEGGGIETGEDSLCLKSRSLPDPSATSHCSRNSLPGENKKLVHHFKRKRRISRNSVSSAETGVVICSSGSSAGSTERKSIFKLFTTPSSASPPIERGNILKLFLNFGHSNWNLTKGRKRALVHPWLSIGKAIQILSPLLPSNSGGSKTKIRMDHEDLIAELPQIEKLSNQERLRLAHKRRMLQLKRFQQYDKEIGSRKHKNGTHDLNKKGAKGLNGVSATNGGKPGGKRIKFRNSIMLLEAAGRNDVEEVRRLLSSGVSPDSANEDGLTALHQCCIDDNEEMMKLLLDYGANVNSEDSERWTPLHAAATCGHLHLVKYLIVKGANLLAVNAEGNMPYDICDEEATLDYIESEMAKRGVTQELIEDTRALPETVMLKDMQNLLARGGDLESRDVDGATPLHISAANGYYRVVECLLDNHVATDVQDKDNWQPIHAAACWGHMDVLELLVQNGADLNARTRNNETPYAICEDPEIKERIIQLRNEQEVKKEAANSRRLKRTQSSNSRTQSIRRTSQRDKGLTTKRDTANEAHALMSRDDSLKDNSPSPTTDPTNNGESTNVQMIEASSEDDAEEKMTSNHPAAFGRSSISQIKVASNEAEKLQLLAEKAGVATDTSSTPTTINNNLKSGHVKNINVNSNINNHQNQTKQFNTPTPPSKPPKPHQVIDTNANLPKPEINPMEKVQIGSGGISLSGSRDSLVGVGNGTIDIHVQVTINASSPSSTLTHGGHGGGRGGDPVLPALTSPYRGDGFIPGSTLLTPPGTLADLKKHRSLSRTTSNPHSIHGGLSDLPPNKKSSSSYGAPPSPTASLQRFVGEPTEIRDYGDGGKKCCTIV